MRTYKFISFLILILFILPYCRPQKENNKINEIAVIEKIEANNYYKKYSGYTIIERTPHETYIVEIDSPKVYFNCWFGFDKGTTLDSYFENILIREISKYNVNNPYEIKNNILKKLNTLISFMVKYNIKWVDGINKKDREITLLLNNGVRLVKSDSTKKIIDVYNESAAKSIYNSTWVIIR